MINEKIRILLINLIIHICFLTFFTSSIQAADVTLGIGGGSGIPGSNNNIINMVLFNPSHGVKGIQANVIDDGNYLTCTGCTPPPYRWLLKQRR